MKNILLVVGMLLSVALHAQDIKKLQKEFDSLMRTTSYGHDSTVGKYYDIRGFKMYCEVYGEGEPLLIIHGNGGSIDNFIKQIPYFSKKYKVIIADSRAQGKSTDNSDSLTYEMMADDYAALLTALKVDSANVIGWSDGGINALLLAIRHPEKVKKLAVTGANLRPDSTAVYPEVINMFMPRHLAMKKKANKTERDRMMIKMTSLLMEQPHISLQELHTIKVPALIIGGDHDVIREEHTMEIYKNIANADLWILPNSGHATPVVYADEFNATVDRFFANPYRKIKGAARFF